LSRYAVVRTSSRKVCGTKNCNNHSQCEQKKHHGFAAPAGSEVRIRNNSGYPFRKVVVNGEHYGNINAGETSEYRHLRAAYRYASVKLIVAP
jgi:hypothetical protein